MEVVVQGPHINLDRAEEVAALIIKENEPPPETIIAITITPSQYKANVNNIILRQERLSSRQKPLRGRENNPLTDRAAKYLAACYNALGYNSEHFSRYLENRLPGKHRVTGEEVLEDDAEEELLPTSTNTDTETEEYVSEESITASDQEGDDEEAGYEEVEDEEGAEMTEEATDEDKENATVEDEDEEDDAIERAREIRECHKRLKTRKHPRSKKICATTTNRAPSKSFPTKEELCKYIVTEFEDWRTRFYVMP